MANGLKVGDKVFVGGSQSSYIPSVVTKVLPSGAVDVLVGRGETPDRFRENGKIQKSKDKYVPRYFLDFTPYEEREAMLASVARTKVAAVLVGAIGAQNPVNYQWGKEGLAEEVARLQSLLNKAKAAVDAI